MWCEDAIAMGDSESGTWGGCEPQDALQGGYFHDTLRRLQQRDISIQPHNLMYPIFLLEDDDAEEPVESLPGVSRYGINKLLPVLRELTALELQAVLLFGVVDKLPKDGEGSAADCAENPVVRALPVLRRQLPTLLLAADVCLCPYTSHGHCGLVDAAGHILPDASARRLAAVALAYARAGAHVLAPSDMTDGRVGAIKRALHAHRPQLQNRVALLSYSCKFASALYGPFRATMRSAPLEGDRRCYQVPAGAAGLALRAAARDVRLGADMLMVKPALPYLDVVRQVRDAFPAHPLYVYQVSGEYAMLVQAAEGQAGAGQAGAVTAVTAEQAECLVGMRRAGADCIITYLTPRLLRDMARDPARWR